VCYSGSTFIYLSPSDRTDVGEGVVCVRLSDVQTAEKLAYYGARLLTILGL